MSWDNSDNIRRYGAGSPGTATSWKRAYEDRMGSAEYEQVINDSRKHGSLEDESLFILGIQTRPVTEAIIRKAFRKLVMKVHPDHGGNAEDFKKVRAAYSMLMDKYGS